MSNKKNKKGSKSNKNKKSKLNTKSNVNASIKSNTNADVNTNVNSKSNAKSKSKIVKINSDLNTQNLIHTKKLKTKLENGEITQAEYNTLSVTTTQQAKDAFNASTIESIATVDNTALFEQLTDEDLQYLNIK